MTVCEYLNRLLQHFSFAMGRGASLRSALGDVHTILHDNQYQQTGQFQL